MHLSTTVRLAIAVAVLWAAGPASAADITVKVDNVKSSEGSVRLMLFDSAGWPRIPDKDIGVPAVEGSTTVVMHDVPPGEYAFVAYHDIDNSGRVNVDGVGKPIEPFAVSSEPPINGRPPEFGQASFKLKEVGVKAQVTLITLP